MCECPSTWRKLASAGEMSSAFLSVESSSSPGAGVGSSYRSCLNKCKQSLAGYYEMTFGHTLDVDYKSGNLVVGRPLKHLLQDLPTHVGQRHQVPILTKQYFSEEMLGKIRTQQCDKNKEILTSPSMVRFSNSCLMVTDFFATFKLKFNAHEKLNLLLVSNLLLIKIDAAFVVITSMSTSKIFSSLDLSLMTDILGLLLSYFWKGFPPFKFQTLLTI